MNTALLLMPGTCPTHSDHTAALQRAYSIARLLSMLLVATLSTGVFAFATDPPVPSQSHVAEQAKAVWESGAIAPALDMLDQGLQVHPDAVTLHKLRGDILAASRGPAEAVQAYDTVLARTPSALDVRWAKWSVLVRWGQGEDALAELRRIAQSEPGNPLIHMRLAQELRKLDRLEESLDSYQTAVALAPELLGWRLAMARARFDILDYQGAGGDVQEVLHRMPPGSPLELPAKNLLSIIDGTSMERGRRYERVLTPDATEHQLREWAAIRADAWRLFEAGQYREAEPLYRRLLALNAKDPIATHQLGLTLMQLGRCKDALAVFGKMSNLDPSDEDYADTVFRMGQCLVELEQWEEAFVHFQILYDSAVEFEEANKHVTLPPDTRVLDKRKLLRWLDKVRPHVPGWEHLKDHQAAASQPAAESSESGLPAGTDVYAQAIERVRPQNPLETRASLLGRDADFSWFRFVIPAGKVMRDDFPTGAHEFIPLNAGDSFPPTQREIYLVFGLVSASYDAMALSAQCFLETAGIGGDQRPVAQDRVMTSMNDQSGYFMLTPPETGWPAGLYLCGLFAGDRTSAYTQVDDVRFRIVAPARPSGQGRETSRLSIDEQPLPNP